MKPTSDSTSQSMLDWWSKDAIVYFITAGSPPSAVKIGVTIWTQVRTRLGRHQSSNHEQLELIGLIPYQNMPFPMRSAEDKERELHEQFRSLQRFPEGTPGYEWFSVTPDLIRWIEQHSQKPEDFGFLRFASRKTGPKKKANTVEQGAAANP